MLVLEDEKRFFSKSKRFVAFRRSTLSRYAVLWVSCSSAIMFRYDEHRDISENPFAQPHHGVRSPLMIFRARKFDCEERPRFYHPLEQGCSPNVRKDIGETDG